LSKFIILIFTITSLFSNQNYELKLYEKILPAIFKKDHLKIYVDAQQKNIIKNSDIFTIVSDCNDALFLIGKKFGYLDMKCLSKPLFSTSYKSFNNQENSFGAFYWRKGRPQIKFKKNVLLRYNLQLPDSLKRFVQ